MAVEEEALVSEMANQYIDLHFFLPTSNICEIFFKGKVCTDSRAAEYFSVALRATYVPLTLVSGIPEMPNLS